MSHGYVWGGHIGEILFRQGWHVVAYPHKDAAIEGLARRVKAAADTVNPPRDYEIRPLPERTAERWGTERAIDVRCSNPECFDPVAASVGVHYDCRAD